MRLALAVALLGFSSIGTAGRTDSASVDWARGLVVARGVGPADLRSPSPDIARVAAERTARAELEKRLREALRALPLARGGTLGARIDKHKQAAAAVDEIVRGTRAERTLHSDGSVTMQVTVPLTRVDETVLGASPEAEERATLLLVDARKAKVKPALGWKVRAGDVVRAAPTYFVAGGAEPAAADDVLVVRATTAKDGVLVVDLPKAKLAEAKGLWVQVMVGP